MNATCAPLPPRAVELMAAVRSKSVLPEMRVELADLLAALGRFAEAIEHYQAALAVCPGQIPWRCNLAVLLGSLRRHREALTQATHALSLDPHFAPALFNQGTSLLALNEPQRAREAFARCALITPDDPRVHNNLGLALAAEHQFEAAVCAYNRSLSLKPAYARALNNRASARMSLNEHALAIADLDGALAMEPRYTPALLNRAAAQRALGRYVASLENYRQAFPDPEALACATDLLMRELRRPDEALECAAELYRCHADRDGAVGALHAVSQSLARWSDYEARIAPIVSRVRTGGRPTTPLQFLFVTDDPDDQHACARAAAAVFARRPPLWRGEPYRHSRVRVAYLSADFHAHATAYLAAGLFERHDRDRYECFALSYGPCADGDPTRERLRSGFEHFEDVGGLTVKQIAERVRSLEIDVLVDLKGYTAGSRIEVLSHRPAPVQVHFLGYPGTLGAPFVDYLVADDHVVPRGQEIHYSEQVIRLPHTYQATDDRRIVNFGSWTRERAGLPATGLVLAAFHQTYKLNPLLFDSWMRVMRALPGACLWLLVREPSARRQLLIEAGARGVEPSRIVFADEIPQADHLARQQLADLLLDTWPYGAHTTASDALWVGLPVVALSGRSFAARVSGSVLRAAGFPELITRSLPEYEELIARLCGDVERLHQLRREIASRAPRSPLFDTATFTRALENGYLEMLERRRSPSNRPGAKTS